MRLWELRPIDADRVTFVFEGQPSDRLLAGYAAGDIEINVAAFVRALRELKRKLYQRGMVVR